MTTIPHLNYLLDDLTITQYRMLIDYLWVNQYQCTAPAIKQWRKSVGLPN